MEASMNLPRNHRNAPRSELVTRSLSVRSNTIDEKARSIEVVLATDNPVRVYDWNLGSIDEVLRMDGVELPEQLPMLADHEAYSIEAVRGSIRNLRIDGGLLIGRAFFADDTDSERAWQKVRGGHLTDLSVGYEPRERTVIERGQTALVGGKSYTANQRSLAITTRWVPKEGSLVPIGADAASKVRASTPNPTRATEPKEDAMNFEQWLAARGFDPKSINEKQRSEMQALFDAENKRNAPPPVAPVAPAAPAPSPVAPTNNPGTRADESVDIVKAAESLGLRASDYLGSDYKAATQRMHADAAKAKPAPAPVAAPVIERGEEEIEKTASELVSRWKRGERLSDSFRSVGHRLGLRAGASQDDIHSQIIGGLLALGQRTNAAIGKVSSDMGVVTQLAAAKAVLDGFAQYTPVHPKWCKTVFVPDFNTVTISDLGLAVLAAPDTEGAVYGNNTPTIRGGSGANEFIGTNFDISLAAIYNDRAGLLLDRLNNLGVSGAMSLDSISQVALAAASFAAATQALALSAANIVTAYDAHAALAVAGGLAQVLIVPKALAGTGRSVTTLAPGMTVAPIFTPDQLVIGEYLTDANDWYLQGNPGWVPSIVLLRHPDYQAPRLVAKGEGGGANLLFRIDFPAKAVALAAATGKPLGGYKCTVTG
jgi:hypothetical protein